ncbi:MAG: LPS export ABC transporter periplasmic protein LptC [Alphaproteobacteria bacterium]|nr:LPS export ABC transporter periplasmic protein LptC [Alphaproteobacteria bacterium]
MNTETMESPQGKPATKLGSVRPRDTRRALAQSGTHSRRVGLLRWLLPVLAFLSLATLVIWPMIGAPNLNATIAQAIPDLVVENLRLSGMDSNNQPYALTAARALQAKDAKNMVDLEKLQGDIALTSGAWLAGKADQGRLDQETKRLWLGGNVQMFHDQGYQFTTSETQIDMGQNTAWGDKPIVIQGTFGEIRGQGFKILERGKVVVVEGHAEARFNLHEKPASDKPPVEKTGAP